MHSPFAVRLEALSAQPGCGGFVRLLAELRFCVRVSAIRDGEFDSILAETCSYIADFADRHGAITEAAVTEAERLLSPMSAVCKGYTLLFAGHAHIDMNWMWRFDETVSITLDTLRTALDLMSEFPDFRFSQSQASVYDIVRRYAPDMLEEIRARVAAGQWEVTASTWVEADRNMPCAESVARNQLYTKRFLSDLLRVPEDNLRLDFEPDTFGHSENTPEQLSKAGISWYYHCRGEDALTLYRWRAPSGAEVLAYREPHWYLGPVDDTMADFVPEFCSEFGMDTALRVFGVGDHGGGPTRRDILRVREMARWPLYPTIRFGTFAEFFTRAELVRERLPVAAGERNRVFTGCYTSQSRIKKGNYASERALYESEALSFFASRAAGMHYDARMFETAWRNVLFNQFHDILPGSGVCDTREHAMGLYQETWAAAGAARREACRALAARINTSSLATSAPDDSTSAGAGVGYGVESLRLAPVERGAGPARIWHLFNSLDENRCEIVELIAWDWRENGTDVCVTDAAGRELPCQIVDKGFQEYWGHSYLRLLARVDVPALGYATCVLRKPEPTELIVPPRADPRVHRELDTTLENAVLRARFDPVTGALCSLTDKRLDRELLSGPAQFRCALEATDLGMSAWTTGRYIEDMPVSAREIRRTEDGPLRDALAFCYVAEGCEIRATVSLGADDDALCFEAECDWLRPGSETAGMPRLDFALTLAETPTEFFYDIPGGSILRRSSVMDAPSQGLIAGGGLALLCEGKYGMRGNGAEMRAGLLRSSYQPDPFPELGRHTFRFHLRALPAGAAVSELLRDRARRSLPLVPVSNTAHTGYLPIRHSFLCRTGGSVVTSAVKGGEDMDCLILRGYETDGDATYAEYRFDVPPKSACLVNTMEKQIPGDVRIIDTRVRAYIPANSLFAIRVCF